ncbi:MAG: hypothetical protein GXY03_00075 [Solirubrobacterales bacterium]|nr:hypothetical protein [Solirubrobacterales bacterium]
MEAFGVVLIVVALVGAVVAIASFAGAGRIYSGLGRGGLSLEDPALIAEPERGSAAWQAEARAELRQLLEAKAARAAARGEEPIDVDAELVRLLTPAPAADPELLAEVRSLVEATNDRRARRGEPPLDVDAEVARRLADAGG